MDASDNALRWDLGDLYRDDADPAIERDLATAADRAATLARHRGQVATLAPAALQGALQAYEELLEFTYRPSLYASLRFAADTGDAGAQSLLARTREAGTRVAATVKFLDVEIKQAPAAVFAVWAAAPELAAYRHFLQAARKGAPHTLSEPEEKVDTLKTLTGAAAWAQLYDETVSALRVYVDGMDRPLTVDEARALRSSSDRALRERATRAIHEVHAEKSHVLTFVFNTLFQDHKVETDLRGYSDPIAPTLLDDELPREAVESLMAITEENYPMAQEYYRLKARVLGLSKIFASHDLLAPLPGGEVKVPLDQAKKLVLESFAAFSPGFAEIAERHFARRWIDLMPRQGKRGGAFCSGALPSIHPYVLTNYSERLEDVSTIAHELGHAIHFTLAGKQRLLNYHPTTPMAETASVFGEILLMRRLLEREKDPEVRRSLLAMRIEDILATVFRQVMYTRWEQQAHRRRADGIATAADYGDLWRAQLKKLYGSDVCFSSLEHWGWIGIPHFIHSRFYCYSYAFGQLLVLALYRRYLDEGERFVPRYLELLAGGGSATPEELLAGVGIDVRAPGFWQQGFATLGGLIKEFQETL